MVQQIKVSLQLPVKQNTKCSYGKMDSLTERGHRAGVGANLRILRLMFACVGLVSTITNHPNLAPVHSVDNFPPQEEGTLTGVIDDRGKFIYISRDELEAVAKFIRQRGRVSIAELAESSNKLINISPEQATT